MSKVYRNVRLFSQTILRAAACLTAIFIFAGAASAVTYTVDTTADNAALTACTSTPDDCSLRGAITNANASAANDTINFAIPTSDTGCAIGVCTITLMLGELGIGSAATAGTLLIENATGAGNLRISGRNATRVFVVSGSLTLTGGNLTLTGVTVTNGANSGGGGGIFNGGTLTINNSIVSGNTAANGGGIFNNLAGTLTINNSTVSGNTASSSGGGIFNQGIVNINNSTVSGNTGDTAGGIFHSQGTLSLTSATVAFNSSTSTSCTVCVGGIRMVAGAATLNNTIVARNTVAGSSTSPDFSGAIAAGSSFNLIGDGTGATSITNGTSNQVGTSTARIDPLLGALANNGGPTPTHALQTGSPAIDQGNATGTDQRGITRPSDNGFIPNAAGGNGADIGSFEVQQAPTAANVSVSGRVVTASGRGIRNVSITITDANGNERTATTSSFGYYRFDDVTAGETVTVSAKARRFRFNQSSIVRTTNESVIDANFVSVD